MSEVKRTLENLSDYLTLRSAFVIGFGLLGIALFLLF